MASPTEFVHGTNLTRVIFEIIKMAVDGYVYDRIRADVDPAAPWQEARDKLRGIWHLHQYLDDPRFNLAIDKHIDQCNQAITDPRMRSVIAAAIRALD